MAAEESKQVEIGAVIREIQDRVRARYPLHAAGSSAIPLADLMPVVHARDRAEAKVAALGTVNPRPPGLVNNLIQSFKNTVARSLNWFIRDQIAFNRASMECVETLLEAMNENNRALQALAAQMDGARAGMQEELAGMRRDSRQLTDETRELKDIRIHWSQWRQEWERKLSVNEIQFLRSVADLQTAFQHRATLMEGNFRDIASTYHKDFTVALDQARLDIQQRLWADLDKARTQYEKLIHNELRVMRQRVSTVPPAVTAPARETPLGVQFHEPPIDFLRFADRFRGTEDYVRSGQRRYVPVFAECGEVLDIGCGRGEFLECLRDAGVLVKGIDSNAEMVAICRAKGLYAEVADLFDYLGELEETSLDGIFCGQVVEHLPPHRLPEFISLAAAALRPGGRFVMETPNPECLAIFASHFYLDPTHQRPVPASLLAFYLEESGFGKISVEYLSPAVESMPSVKELPDEFRRAFFGGLDYCISATRL
ncbi:MAG TPA: class I SAM-dependent methyltransferase [Bryobacteraceae bacterium]|nr:class I SAM-dependent methyltransferase [Bryobacteraceae bacterium]